MPREIELFDSIDHINRKSQALRRLSEFPNEPKAKEAIQAVVAEIPPEPAAGSDEAEVRRRINELSARRTAIEQIAKVFPRAEAQTILEGLLENQNEPEKALVEHQLELLGID